MAELSGDEGGGRLAGASQDDTVKGERDRG